jgi:parallel beta-helix repeat protein
MDATPLARHTLAVVAGLAIAVTAFTVLGSAQAFGDQVTCGETITKDTTLDNDLIDCPGDGIVIGADKITLDLNGHTISGAGTGSGVSNSGVFNQGNFVSPGHDWVTIENGTIKHFRHDLNYPFAGGFGIVVADGADHNRLSGLSVSENETGIYVSRSDATLIEQSSVSANSLGIHVNNGSDHTVIERNSVFDNKFGIDLYESGPDVVDRNAVFHNAYEGISASRVNVLITKNSVVSNGNEGILLQHAGTGTRIEKNDISANGLGIQLNSADVDVLRNSVTDNVSDGIEIGDHVDALVEDNVTSRNGRDGIYAFEGLLARNTANDNGVFGIEGGCWSYTLTNACARDGGGNRAKGNGNPLQCLNVVCKP